MNAQTLMIQGTAPDAGKNRLVEHTPSGSRLPLALKGNPL